MPPRLIHDEEAFAFAQGLAQVYQKHVHHFGVDPWQKEADLLTGDRAYCAVDIEILITRAHCYHRTYTFTRPAARRDWLKTEASFVKEKNMHPRATLEQFREFF